ncbi:MAG: cation:proton antiporter [Pseudomonadales bacterium]
MEAFEQLALIWAGVLVAVWAAKHTRLTPVLYYLAVGAILVNAGLLPETPHEFIRGFAEIGILLIMFAIGFEEQANNFIASMRRSWGIALFGAIAPFAAAYAVTWYFWQNFAVALMAGLAMTATAVSLTMVALKAEGLAASPPATRIMTSAVLDDIGSLALVAIMVPIAKGGDFPGAVDLLIMIGKVVVFFSIVTVLGNWVFPHDSKSWVARIPGLRYFNMRGILRFEKGEYAVLILLLLAMVTGLTAHAFGFHPAVGAYMAGLIIREEYFDYDDTRDLAAYRDVKRLVDNVAFSWIGPVFFVLLGAHLIFTWRPLLPSFRRP